MLQLFVSLLATALSPAAQDESHFAFVGPFSKFMVEGKTPAPVSSGLPFSIVLSEGGKTVVGGPYELKIGGSSKPLTLTLEGLRFENGHITAKAKLVNKSGAAVEGVRLDIVGASETYKDASETKTRAQKVSQPSPLSFGDLAADEDTGPLDVDISTLTFAPDTVQVTVTGVISGLQYVRTISVEEASPGGQIEVDSADRVFLQDLVNHRVLRMKSDGKNVETAAKLPNQTASMAVNKVTGEIAAACGQGKIHLFTKSGDDRDPIDSSKGYDWNACWLRYDSRGSIWASAGSIVRVGASGKVEALIEKLGDFSAESPGFDVAPDGALYAVAENTLFRTTDDGKKAKRIATGPSWRLGQLTEPRSARVDAKGNVYVVEMESDTEAARISVFDKDGNFVRAFGRGSKTRPNPDEQHEAQVFQPGDVAFGPDGKVYVSCARHGGGAAFVLIFQPF